MNMKLVICCIVLLGLFFRTPVMSEQSEDQKKEEIQSLLTTAKYFRDVNWDSSYYYAQKAYSRAESNGFDFELAEAMYYTGIIQCLRSDYKEAEQNFSKSLKIFEALDDQKRIADMHNAFGRYYRFTSSYGESLKHLYKASKILEEVGNERSLSIVLNNIAATYERLTDFPKALEYGERAYQIALKMNDTINIFNSGTIVANILYSLDKNKEALDKYKYLLGLLDENKKYKRNIILNNMANIYSEFGDYSAAEKSYKECLKMAESTGDKYGKSTTLLNIGHVYHKQKKFNEALEYYVDSEQLSKEIDDVNGVAVAIDAQGVAKYGLGFKDEAIKYLLRSAALFQDMKIDLKLAATYKKLGEINSELANYKDAYFYQKKYLELKEKNEKKERDSFEDAISMKLNTEAEMELLSKDLEQQKTQYEDLVKTIIISSIFVAFLILIFILFYKTRKKLKINRSKLSKKEEFNVSIYKKMTEDLNLLLLHLSIDIAKLENKENYENMSASFLQFSKKYNRILTELKANNS